jgi:fructose-1-phosphate kinase PfkB-like protein
VGALASGLASGLTVDAALADAVRVSAAAAAHPETGRFDPAFAATLTTTSVEL